MKGKQKKTLNAIFAKQTQASIKFKDIESLIIALGGEVRDGEGSRVVFELSSSRKYAHRPPPWQRVKKVPN